MNRKQLTRIAQLTLTAVAALTLAGHAEARNYPSRKVIVVRPSNLPELARVTGQAMLLHATGDGRTHLYIEQNQGAQLAIFDVTDPANVIQEGSAQLNAPGEFDFVSSLGDYAELGRFRNGQGFQGATERLGDDGLIIADQPNVRSDAYNPNYQVVDLSNPLQPIPLADVRQVREKIENDETGTTFLLAPEGLYLIRRPAVEEEYEIHEYQMEHPG